jgi:hypothetical protein
MSIQTNPIQMLKDITQKRVQLPKREKTEFFHQKYKNFKPVLSIDNPELPDQDSFGDMSLQADNKKQEKNFLRANKLAVSKPQGHNYIKAEDGFSRISPAARIPSRESSNMPNISFFQSKNKEKADGDPIFMIRSRLEKGAQYFLQENYQDALMYFSQAESLVESYCSKEKKMAFETVFLVFYNLIAANYK